jgi:2-keto-3-deoxy-L-rhamnonate aldolase RhmA
LKDKLTAGAQTIGVWMGIPSPDVTLALAQMDFDWFLYDNEHSALNDQITQDLMMVTRGTDIVPLVRVAWNDPVLVKRALDIGAYGVIIPWVNTKEEAINAVQACKYPPEGIRGVGPRIAAIGDPQYLATANEEILVIVQIETEEAVKNVEAIFSVQGVDGFFIGPADLSTSLGVMGKYNDPKVVKAIDKILEAGKKVGVSSGIYGMGLDDVKQRLRQGFQFISIASDLSLLGQGATFALKELGRLK